MDQDHIVPESRFHSVLLIENGVSPIMLVEASICSNLRPCTHKKSVFHEQLERQSPKFVPIFTIKVPLLSGRVHLKKCLKWSALLSKTCIKRTLKNSFCSGQLNCDYESVELTLHHQCLSLSNGNRSSLILSGIHTV